MVPLLELAKDKKEHAIKDTYKELADRLGLSDEDRSELLPSGRQETYKNRVGWARTYLSKAGLLENTKRGYFRITERGIDELEHHSNEISTTYLRKYDEFVEFQTTSRETEKPPNGKTGKKEISETPEEAIENALSELNDQLASELLSSLHAVTPSFFERIVVQLLVAMGYGGSIKEAGTVVGKSGDGGIDGIIKEDRLGLDAMYVQAKRWDSVVGRPEIQKFVGALQGQRAQKGIFITTSDYTREAVDYAGQVQNKVVLINGRQLAQLMIEHGIGTTTIGAYAVKRLDSDYFAEE
jgi:restriction system protein